jgi:hypothetical protein
MAKRKKGRKSGAALKRSRKSVPAIYFPQVPRMGAARRPAMRLPRMPRPAALLNNVMNGGSVLAGEMLGNFISGVVPVKQALMQAAINIAIGMVVVGTAGRYQKIALVGAGCMANGINKTVRNLFPAIPYLSGETLQITPNDVQRAVDTGAISQDEGAALLATMQGEMRRYGESDAELMGAMYDLSGDGTPLEAQFVTTDSAL